MSILSQRLGKFGLELAEEKSGLVRFSRFALKANGSFSFLGFLYHWTLSRNGKPKVQRMTDPKKLHASVAKGAQLPRPFFFLGLGRWGR